MLESERMDEDEDLERIHRDAWRFSTSLLLDYEDEAADEQVMRQLQERLAQVPEDEREPFLVFSATIALVTQRGLLRVMDASQPLADPPLGRAALAKFTDMAMGD